MDCIFIPIFKSKNILNVFLLIESIRLNRQYNDNIIDIVIYTNNEIQKLINAKIKSLNNIIVNDKFTVNEIDNDIFLLDMITLPQLKQYNKVFFIETNIILSSFTNELFNLIDTTSNEKIYFCGKKSSAKSKKPENGNTPDGYFIPGIIGFHMCEEVNQLFEDIKEIRIKKSYILFVQNHIYQTGKRKSLVNTEIFKDKVFINSEYYIPDDGCILRYYTPYCLYGQRTSTDNIISFLKTMTNKKHGDKIVYHTRCPPHINTTFPIIGICVCYNYYDTLQLTLPINYYHFTKIYVVTQHDDTDTINLCKQYGNVNIVYYNFSSNGKIFDKYGGIKTAQEIAYAEHKEHWYLLMDSDILLPNNFIQLLEETPLNYNCMYAAVRKHVLKVSELLRLENFNEEPLRSSSKDNGLLDWDYSPTVVGWFQLYRNPVLQNPNYDDASCGDINFSNQFDLYSCLSHILCFHLGNCWVNWKGKVDYFIHDIRIDIKDVYYNSNIKCQNIVYNKKFQVVCDEPLKINYDCNKCSNHFANDLELFFKSKYLNVLEIGSHKGFTTKMLSDSFLKVYTIDNNDKYIDFNKEYNQGKSNISYHRIISNLTELSFISLPDSVECIYINAVNSKNGILEDLYQTVSYLKNIQYIIISDYYSDIVKQNVDTLILKNVLQFIQYIGFNQFSNVYNSFQYKCEGVLCKLGENYTELIKERYNPLLIKNDTSISTTNMLDLLNYSDSETYTSSDFDAPTCSKKRSSLQSINPIQSLLSDIDMEEPNTPLFPLEIINQIPTPSSTPSTVPEDNTQEVNMITQRPVIVRKNIQIKLKQQNRVTKIGMNFARRGR